ncbi:hypothetical protein XA68_10834 [Ophiocordyceps unilateralis]|uniref:Small acidic protein n=1 Tax=Ophiocordyceps unilateralis TaxID=268505 RepID=A0A2A9PI04_OPHUN|nr:hypothetical protein XA68_10834 [Ophiocordyceps unilateralis]
MTATKSPEGRSAGASRQGKKTGEARTKNREKYGGKLTAAETKAKKAASVAKKKERKRKYYLLKKQKLEMQAQRLLDEAKKAGELHEAMTRRYERFESGETVAQAENVSVDAQRKDIEAENASESSGSDGGAPSADASADEAILEPPQGDDPAPEGTDVSTPSETKLCIDEEEIKPAKAGKREKKHKHKKNAMTQEAETLATGESDSTGKRKRDEASDITEEVEEPVAKKDKKNKEEKKKKKKEERKRKKEEGEKKKEVKKIEVEMNDVDQTNDKGENVTQDKGIKSDKVKKDKKKSKAKEDKGVDVTEKHELNKGGGDESGRTKKDKKSKFKEELADEESGEDKAEIDDTNRHDKAQTQKQDKKEKREKRKDKESKKHKKQGEKAKEAADGQDSAAAAKWNVGELTGGVGRQDKFLRLMGCKSASSSGKTSGNKAKEVSDATKAEADIQRQFEAGVKMKAVGGGKRRGLGA